MIKLLTKGESRTIYCPYDPAYDWAGTDPAPIVEAYMGSADEALLAPYQKEAPTPFEIVGLSGYEIERCRIDRDDSIDWCYEVLRYGIKASPVFDPAWRVDGAWPRSVVDSLPAGVAQFLAVMIVRIGSFDVPTKKASTSSRIAGGANESIAPAAEASQS